MFQHNLDAAREAYDAFLARYPYCYGYWKKYADMEKKHDHFDEAEEVSCSRFLSGFVSLHYGWQFHYHIPFIVFVA